MTKINPNNRNETKSDIFLWGIFKFEIFSLVANTKIFQCFYYWHGSIEKVGTNK